MGCAGPETKARVRKDLENPESKASKTLQALFAEVQAKAAGTWREPLPVDFEAVVFATDITFDHATRHQSIETNDRATTVAGAARTRRSTVRLLQVAATIVVMIGIGYGTIAYARMANALTERDGQLVEERKTVSERDNQLQQVRKDLTHTAEHAITELRGLQTVLKECDRLLKEREPTDPIRSEIKKVILAVQLESTKLSVHTVRRPVFAGDKSTWIKDLGIQDDSEVKVNQTMTRIWRIKNIGTVHWKNRFLQREDDPAVPGRLKSDRRVPIPDTPPGSECDIRVDFVAPDDAGISYSEWKMVDADGNYLLPTQTPLFIRVNVVAKK
jgi:hypothetical protein